MISRSVPARPRPWLFAVTTLALATPLAGAQSSVWIGGDGSWFDAANWDPGVPAGNTTIIGNGGTARIGAGDASTSILGLGALEGESGSLVHTNGTLTVSTLLIGRFADSMGSYSISGPTSTFTGGLGIGQEGAGIVHVADGARVDVPGLLVVGGQRVFAVDAEAYGHGELDAAGANTVLNVLPGSGLAGYVEVGGGGTGLVTLRDGATLRAAGVVVLALSDEGSELVVTGDASLLDVTGDDVSGFLDLGYASALYPSLPTPDAHAMLTVGAGATVRSSAEITLTAGGLVRGVGLIDARLRNFEGVIQPGIDEVGDLHVTGALHQTGAIRGQSNGGVLEIDIAGVGPGAYDTLTVAAALLGGTLRVKLLDDYSPDVGARFEVLRCVEPDLIDLPDLGDFHALDLPPLAPGRAWAVDVALTGVTLRVAPASGCPADLAEPFGIVDFSDALTFLTAFGAGASPADMDEPFGVHDYSDVLAFLTAFAQGCP